MNTATTAPVPDIASAPRPPMVRGLPLIGSTIEMAANPAKFFARCYRDYGSAFRVRVFGNDLTVIAGAEAATRSEEHTSEIQSLKRISYDVYGLTHTTHTK